MTTMTTMATATAVSVRAVTMVAVTTVVAVRTTTVTTTGRRRRRRLSCILFPMAVPMMPVGVSAAAAAAATSMRLGSTPPLRGVWMIMLFSRSRRHYKRRTRRAKGRGSRGIGVRLVFFFRALSGICGTRRRRRRWRRTATTTRRLLPIPILLPFVVGVQAKSLTPVLSFRFRRLWAIAVFRMGMRMRAMPTTTARTPSTRPTIRMPAMVVAMGMTTAGMFAVGILLALALARTVIAPSSCTSSSTAIRVATPSTTSSTATPTLTPTVTPSFSTPPMGMGAMVAATVAVVRGTFFGPYSVVSAALAARREGRTRIFLAGPFGGGGGGRRGWGGEDRPQRWGGGPRSRPFLLLLLLLFLALPT